MPPALSRLRHSGATQTSTIPSSRSPRVSWHEATRYCEWLMSANRPRLSSAHRSRMGARRSRRPRTKAISLGRRPAAVCSPTTPRAGKPAPSPSRATLPTLSVSTTFATTSTNGAATGTIRITMQSRPIAIPQGPEHSPMKPPRKSSRGGSWRHHIKVSRCSARSSIPPEFQYADYGFRVACNP